MRAVILNGASHADETLENTANTLTTELTRRGWTVDSLILRDMEIRPCGGCFGCWIQTPGVCIINDAGRGIAKSIIQSDLVIYLTPITFGGYSSQLKKALDRSIGLILPSFKRINGETHHQPRYAQYPRLLGIGLLPQADAESERLFTTLISRNAINMHSPAHAGGVVFHNQSSADIQAKIQTLLEAVEVKR